VDSNPNEIVRAHIWAKGRVQGVGFRAHVEYFALQIGVTGWVRNVGEDTVEAVAEGTREAVGRFIEMVQEGPRMSRVDTTKVEWEPVTGEFAGFGVKHNIRDGL
jgi:acylphosphatase